MADGFKNDVQLCSIKGCKYKARKRGWCNRHYGLWYRNGGPEIEKQTPRTIGASPSNRKAYIKNYKLEHGCVDCGYKAHAEALSFDHLPGTVKVRDIKSGQHFGWQALLDEIAKCEVVCLNCHMVRTANRARTGKARPRRICVNGELVPDV